MTKRIKTVFICFTMLTLFASDVFAASAKEITARMNSSDVNLRRQAAKDLRGMKKINKKMAPVVLKGCRDTDKEVREFSYFAIHKVDPRLEGVFSALVDGMRDTSVDVRRAVISSLNLMNPYPTGCLPHMTKLLFDPDDVVRRETFATFVDLEGIGTGSLAKTLGATTDDDQRIVLAELLGAIGPPAKNALPQLRALLKSEDPDVKAAAERAIGRIE